MGEGMDVRSVKARPHPPGRPLTGGLRLKFNIPQYRTENGVGIAIEARKPSVRVQRKRSTALPEAIKKGSP